MFKLIELKISGHPQLGSFELQFVEEKEVNNQEKPYTTVIIGPNGAGKSFILRTIAEIFRQLKVFQETEGKEINLPFLFKLKYLLKNNVYEISTEKFSIVNKGPRRNYVFFKSKYYRNSIVDQPNQNEKISLKDVEFPDNLIVSSIMLNDRFTFAESKPQDFYQYLGVRRTRSVTSTQTFSKKTIRYLFDARHSDIFLDDFAKMLDFMGFKPFFKIQYFAKYQNLFFSGSLNEERFHSFFKEWWNTGFTRRKKENKPWGLWYYNKLERENPKRFSELVSFLNFISSSWFIRSTGTNSQRIEIDLFNNLLKYEDYGFIEDLINLDLLNLDKIVLKKEEKSFAIEQTSSGEYHLLISLLGLYSKTKETSIVLIDEPEISLHPNWQMRYISFLKRMFSKKPGCHFILSTHSHFLISDLEGNSSSVVSINKESPNNKIKAELLEGRNTYGWSAEEILYKVFKVRTTRNYYLETDLHELLYQISIKSPEKNKMDKILNRVKSVTLSEEDPLNFIIKEAEEYLSK